MEELPCGERRVVLLGAGFGGLYAARALAKSNVRVTVVDRRNHHLFQPLLYQVATAALTTADIAYPIRTILRKQKNAEVLLGEAVSIDKAARRVVLADGATLPYDYLIVATGATHAYFGHEEWMKYAPGLKTLEDALEIRRRILLAFEKAERESDPVRRRELLNFVVVGGGPTGVEMAGAIAEIARHVMVEDFRIIDPRESRILLVEAGPRVLHTFPEDLSRDAYRALRQMGVEVRLSTRVTRIGDGEVWLEDQRVGAGAIVWAAGVQASPLAGSLDVPLDRAGRVPVQADLSVPGNPEIFVIGDLAILNDEHGNPLPGVAPVAIQQGEYVARRIEAACSGARIGPFSYHDRGSMATIGRAHAVAVVGRFHLSGFFAWITWLFIHVLWLIGFRNRIVVMVEWAWAYLAFQSSARLITGDINAYSGNVSHSSASEAKSEDLRRAGD